MEALKQSKHTKLSLPHSISTASALSILVYIMIADVVPPFKLHCFLVLIMKEGPSSILTRKSFSRVSIMCSAPAAQKGTEAAERRFCSESVSDLRLLLHQLIYIQECIYSLNLLDCIRPSANAPNHMLWTVSLKSLLNSNESDMVERLFRSSRAVMSDPPDASTTLDAPWCKHYDNRCAAAFATCCS